MSSVAASGQHGAMSAPQPPEADPTTADAPVADAPVAEAAAGSADRAAEDLASANRRRMRAALEHKSGVHHPDDRAGSTGPVRAGGGPAAGRDFTRRRSG